MSSSIFATLVILIILLMILSSLGAGLFYVLFEYNGSKKTFVALALRVGLSMTLFLGLLLAIHFGWIIPNPPHL